MKINKMKKIINKILLKIMNKFNIPTMDISDKEWEQNLKEFHKRLHNELQNEEAMIVPTKQTKELAKIIFSDIEKGENYEMLYKKM